MRMLETNNTSSGKGKSTMALRIAVAYIKDDSRLEPRAGYHTADTQDLSILLEGR